MLYENYKGPAAKLDAICDLVDSAMGGGEKALVFSQFTSFLSIIADKLDAAGVRYFTITGATPKEERLELVNRFNADDTPVFLISLKAGGTGLNLTARRSSSMPTPGGTRRRRTRRPTARTASGRRTW